MYCTKCGKQVSETDKFCSQCGNPIEAEEFVPAFMKELKNIESAVESAPIAEPKEVKIVHHDEFDWNLDGYPQESRRTDDINFEWESVVNKRAADDNDVFMGFKSTVDEPETIAEEKPEDNSQDLEDFLFAKEERKPEQLTDTRVMLRKSEEKVDKFFTFNRKNAEFQALLDQEFARLKKAESERHGTVMSEEELKLEGEFAAELEPEVKVEPAPIEVPAPKEESAEVIEPLKNEETVVSEEAAEQVAEEAAESEEIPEVECTVDTVEEPEETVEPVAEEPADAEEVAEETETAEIKKPELVGVVWATAPAGIVVEAEQVAEAIIEEPNAEPVVSVEAEDKEEPEEEKTVEEVEEPVEEKETERVSEEKVLPPSEEQEKTEQKLTFDDVFGDDDEDDYQPKQKGKGFLRFITIILCILVIAELAMIGIQYFLPESQAAGLINQGYTKVIAAIKGEKEAPAPVAPETPVVTEDKEMVQQLIDASTVSSENIVKVKYSSEAIFEDGEDYGFEEFSKSYEFNDAPWYTDDEGETVTYGQKIIECIIGYYNGMVSQLNGNENSMLDYVDHTSDFYQTAEAISGEEGAEYGINILEIGKIRTSGSGFYVRVNADIANSLEGTSEIVSSVVYIEPFNKEMKIEDKKDL